MQLRENVSLSGYSTMRLGGPARYLAEVTTEDQIPELVGWAQQQGLPLVTIGEGSNIVWRDEGYPGLVIVNRLPGRQVVAEDEQSATIHLAAGENWDKSVAWAVGQGLSGIEFLSLIPGLVGAAPVQNIGAYGGELSNTLKEVGVYDTQTGSFESIPAAGCAFAYRTSRFKTTDKGRFIICSVTLRLTKQNPQPPFYESLARYLVEHHVSDFTPKTIRNAVIAVRRAKLPDPAKNPTNGSFFLNPIITSAKYKQLQKKFPEIKGWPLADGRVKLAAAWLVERAGFKGRHDKATGMMVWPTQAITLVNEHAKSTADLLAFKQKIVAKVEKMFGITLEQEPELLP